MKITKKIASKYEDFIFDWNYETYLLLGGYGSGKSYHIAFKIILKLLEERRKALVVRQVFDTIQESCYDLFCEILDDMGLLTTEYNEYKKDRNKVYARKSPLSFTFHNGSKIIFKGMDKPEKAKSINNVSILWIEECSEIKFEAYEELLGRVRTPIASMHFILSCNPVGKENWVYSHFFRKLEDDGTETVYMDEERLYAEGCLVRGDIYYLHSLPTDNNWLPRKYIKRLDAIKNYDPQLYNVARWGRFGATGTRVLPQFEIATDARKFREAIKTLGDSCKYFGFDFGFEESYNAVVSMAVDTPNRILYIYDEIYVNHITDDKMAELLQMQALKEKLNAMAEAGHNNAVIVADNEDPKAIQYYRQCQFRIRACKNKFAGSRLSNTRKIKRFEHIVVSPKCKNVIRELKDLTYKKDRNGNVIYDEFNIDPHTFSAIWYALDTVTVADVKHDFNSKAG